MNRRSFITLATAGLNALLAAAALVPGIGFLLDPLRRSGGGGGFVRAIKLSALPAGEHVRVPIIAVRQDAFTRYPPGPIGTVWLIREESEDEAEPRVRCRHSICPHLGCAIDHVAERNVFACPCHVSDFDEQGKRLFGPSPRDMDELDCRLSEPDDSGDRWVEVKYESFRTGTENRIPV